MYFSAEYILKAIDVLNSVHPFHGITFLACKKAKLPVGEESEFPMDSQTKKFLEDYHRLDPDCSAPGVPGTGSAIKP